MEEVKSGSVQSVLTGDSKAADTFDLGLDNQGAMELKSAKRKGDGNIKGAHGAIVYLTALWHA